MGESKLRQIADRARKDYYFFCKEILGYSKMQPVPHQELCDFIESPGNRKKLVLMPRGSFKSSIVTIGYPLFQLTQNPNMRILIAGETQKNAKKFAKEIKTHIESNRRFRALFGDWVSTTTTWRDDEFIINRRTHVKKEATVMAASVEKMTVTGMHMDLIVLDDPVSFLNINTPEQFQKTIDCYRLLLSVLEPDGTIIIVGTRYSPSDLYGWLSDDDSPEQGQIDVMIREAEDEQGNLLMPKVLSRAFLEEQRKTQGGAIFACQYLNKVISPEICTFKHEQVRFYTGRAQGLIYFLTVDAAISGDKRSDYTGLILNGVDHDHNWYIDEAIQLKAPPHEVIAKIFELVQKHGTNNFMCVGMERFAFEKFLKVGLDAEMAKRGYYFPIKEIETNTRVSKNARIRSLQPRFESGSIYIRKEHTALYHQIIYHPQLKHDDLIDALKSQLSITHPSSTVAVFEGEAQKADPDAHLTRNERQAWDAADRAIVRRVKERNGRVL